MIKSQIRIKVYEKRNKISKDTVKLRSRAIFENLIKTDILKYNNILVYADFKNEVETGDIIAFLLANNKNVFLPVCDVQKCSFSAIKISEPNFDSQLNSYGIAEPKSFVSNEDEIDCAIVPGIAFDKTGNRIGFGKGYYDKYFENKNIFKIALCYEFQIVDSIPADSHDFPMNMLITEDRVIKIGEEL